MVRAIKLTKWNHKNKRESDSGLSVWNSSSQENTKCFASGDRIADLVNEQKFPLRTHYLTLMHANYNASDKTDKLETISRKPNSNLYHNIRSLFTRLYHLKNPNQGAERNFPYTSHTSSLINSQKKEAIFETASSISYQTMLINFFHKNCPFKCRRNQPMK